MERLHFSSEAHYSALEAAIHMGRYATAKSLCVGRSVLDVACGEGYGSYQLAQWGASEVDGVDISAEAIAAANERFSHPKIKFHQHDAGALEALFPDKKFGLIVCLETIEHVQDPLEFLKSLKRLVASDGTILISCPNDHWYYDEQAHNPFHMRKFTFAEFKELAESVLGAAGHWRFGTLTAGFATLDFEQPALEIAEADDQSAMLKNVSVETALLVPSPIDLRPAPENCSYFLGVWGSRPSDAVSVTYPLSMDAADRTIFGGQENVADLRDYLSRLRDRCDALEGALGTDGVELVNANEKLRQQVRSAEAAQSDLSNGLRDARIVVDAQIAELEKAAELRVLLETELNNRIGTLQDLEAEREIRRAENEELRRELRNISLRFQASHSENNLLRSHVREARDQHLEKLRQLAAERDLADAERDQLKLANDALRAELAEAAEQRVLFENEMNERRLSFEQALGNKGAELIGANEKLKQQLRHVEAAQSDLSILHRDLRVVVDTQKTELEKATELRALLETELNDRIGTIQDLEGERELRRAEIEELRRELRNISLRFHAAQSEIHLLRPHAREFRDQSAEMLRGLSVERDHLKHANDAFRRELAMAAEQRALLVQTIEQQEARLEVVPWRVVGSYRRMRPLVPLSLLKLMARFMDRFRRKL